MDKAFENKKIILASGSPRRIEMLQIEGADFEIIKPGCEEDIHIKLSPKETVMALALRKALTVKAEVGDTDRIIIACDTIVSVDDEIIGKPKDEDDAFKIIQKIRNRAHEVVSGVCILRDVPIVFAEATKVFVKDYSDREIWDYIATKEPMDKAGAYAIQGIFGKYIDHIEGYYSNVVGFPMEVIKEKLIDIF